MCITIRIMEGTSVYALGGQGNGSTQFAVGDKVGLINHEVTKRVRAGPYTIVNEAPRTPHQWPHQYTWIIRKDADDSEYRSYEENMVPWIEGESQIGVIHPGYQPPMALNGMFSLSQLVKSRYTPSAPPEPIMAGPYDIDGRVAYEVGNKYEVYFEDDLIPVQNGARRRRKTRGRRKTHRRRR